MRDKTLMVNIPMHLIGAEVDVIAGTGPLHEQRRRALAWFNSVIYPLFQAEAAKAVRKAHLHHLSTWGNPT